MPEPVEQAQATGLSKLDPPPSDLWPDEARQAQARVTLARLDQHAARPGLAIHMLPLTPLVPPCVTGRCQACGKAQATSDRWGHAVEQHAKGRLRCVRWALGIPEPAQDSNRTRGPCATTRREGRFSQTAPG